MDNLALVGEQCNQHLNEIAEYFKPGVKLTLLARTPGNDEADFVLTNDTLQDAVAALERRGLADRITLAGKKPKKKRELCPCMSELDQCPLCDGTGIIGEEGE
jgi:hypothetical protein